MASAISPALPSPVAPVSRPVGKGGRGAKRVLPGFGLTLGYTVLYLGLIVMIPLSALVFKTFTLTWEQFWVAVTSPRVMASYRLTFGASFLAALVNLVFGLLVAWVLVRYKFPGKKIVDALVDLPFALPTAVAGITLTRRQACRLFYLPPDDCERILQELEDAGVLARNTEGHIVRGSRFLS